MTSTGPTNTNFTSHISSWSLLIKYHLSLVWNILTIISWHHQLLKLPSYRWIIHFRAQLPIKMRKPFLRRMTLGLTHILNLIIGLQKPTIQLFSHLTKLHFISRNKALLMFHKHLKIYVRININLVIILRLRCHKKHLITILPIKDPYPLSNQMLNQGTLSQILKKTSFKILNK